ncbi:MAG: chlorophyll synthase ChlG [Burkholderiaceae bacterium]|nr:chlorophyll synthase ChlG [Burkholderiaceae bacterium]
MAHSPASALALPRSSAVLELLKPVTWFPPMWAFGCGVVSAGQPILTNWALALAGIFLAGPLLCAASQATNDWFDRHVDAINEPGRPIPSGRIPGRWGLYLALLWSALSLVVAAALGPWVFIAAGLGVLLSWAYSAPPLRLKRNGWWGNAAVGLSYEGLAWITGAAVMLGGAMPDARILALALLYSLGAHGIMTLNDFKSMAGDRRMGVGSLPVRLGEQAAARVACAMMAAPQALVVALLFAWDCPWHALAVSALLLVQLGLMSRFLARPRERALWYSALGVNFFVLGMLVAAFGVRGLVAAA